MYNALCNQLMYLCKELLKLNHCILKITYIQSTLKTALL